MQPEHNTPQLEFLQARIGNGPAATEISTLFARWSDLHCGNYEGLSEAETERRLQVYRELQDLITALEPKSAKDLAMQFVVETDRGKSDYRDCFFDRITALATAGTMPEVSELLQRAIARHKAAYAYFAATVYLSDDGILGREATAAEAAAYSAASDAEREALSSVCHFPARTPADLAAKARHLREFHTRLHGYLEDWQVENLLRSMLPDAERDALPEGGAA